ncbi:MAG TPA: UDP-N-acetylglucosamine diphosphorylase [Verrucomicrobiae bacterium]|nr:UDP-N-acetylglucosamine diphosphorylase [Verrucomicrobiae bacterium]
MFRPEEYVDLARTAHRELFEEVEFVWDALKKVGAYLQVHLEPANRGRVMGHAFVGERVYIGDGTVVEPGAVIKGPAWIGRNCQVRAGAYIRENVILGDWVVAGNSCEFKNAVVFDGCEVPHFNYVGDSILGHKAHLGAGVILGNVKLDRSEIVVEVDGRKFPTGLRKFGAIVGDRTEIGCNSVINPGSVLGRDSILYPLSQWRGVLPEKSVVKTRQEQQVVKRRATA